MRIFNANVVEKCESDFFGLIMDVSTEIQTCQNEIFLSANKASLGGVR